MGCIGVGWSILFLGHREMLLLDIEPVCLQIKVITKQIRIVNYCSMYIRCSDLL